MHWESHASSVSLLELRGFVPSWKATCPHTCEAVCPRQGLSLTGPPMPPKGVAAGGGVGDRWALVVGKEFLEAVFKDGGSGACPLSLPLPVGRHKDLPSFPVSVDLVYKLHPTRAKCRRYVVRASVDVQSMKKVPRESVSTAALGLPEGALELLEGRATSSIHIWSLRSVVPCEKGDGMQIIEATHGAKHPWLTYTARCAASGPLRAALQSGSQTPAGEGEDDVDLATVLQHLRTAQALAQGSGARDQTESALPADVHPPQDQSGGGPDATPPLLAVPDLGRPSNSDAAPAVTVVATPPLASGLAPLDAATSQFEDRVATAPEVCAPRRAGEAGVPDSPQPDSPIPQASPGTPQLEPPPETPPATPTVGEASSVSLSDRWSCPVAGAGDWQAGEEPGGVSVCGCVQ